MLAVKVRSELEETFHEGTVAVSSPDGRLVAWSGDVDRPFFLRSSAKPFQAFVTREAGAELAPVELAMSAASHRGHPVQIALVESILRQGGLSEADLQCPHDWPLNNGPRDQLIRSGAPAARRIWHNCSGKHAGFLRASVANGWPLDTYLEPDHPLQVRIVEFVSELGDHDVRPVGVDGCGAPVLRTTARAMSLLFARLGNYPEMSDIFEAMHRYPALVSGNGEGDTSIATATNSVAKGGALGCLGIATKSGLGVAVKSWDGSMEMAGVGAVAALDGLGLLSATATTYLDTVARPPQLGGGVRQGYAEPRLQLEFV